MSKEIKDFKAYYFSEEYEIDCIDGSIELMFLETSIENLKGWFHLECIEKLKNTQDFKSNEKSLKIDFYDMNIDHYIYDRDYCECCLECTYCKKLLDERLITERKKVLEIYKECRSCSCYYILKSSSSNECESCIEYNKLLDTESPF